MKKVIKGDWLRIYDDNGYEIKRINLWLGLDREFYGVPPKEEVNEAVEDLRKQEQDECGNLFQE